nr:uncharacterized protein LOC113826028 [Penaeus vannamei]
MSASVFCSKKTDMKTPPHDHAPFALSKPAQLLKWAGLVAIVGVFALPLVTAQHGAFVGIPGDYCGYRRPSECCDGRYDECSVPIMGTLCYCDQFCNRTYNPDCCPDYWEVCLGVTPTPAPIRTCFKDGVYIPSGKSYKFNCNECEYYSTLAQSPGDSVGPGLSFIRSIDLYENEIAEDFVVSPFGQQKGPDHWSVQSVFFVLVGKVVQ